MSDAAEWQTYKNKVAWAVWSVVARIFIFRHTRHCDQRRFHRMCPYICHFHLAVYILRYSVSNFRQLQYPSTTWILSWMRMRLSSGIEYIFSDNIIIFHFNFWEIFFGQKLNEGGEKIINLIKKALQSKANPGLVSMELSF